MGGWSLPVLSDEACAFCDLREDLVYPRIPRARRSCYLARGLALGREAAARYPLQQLRGLLEQDGVVLNRVAQPSPSGLHAQICYDKKTRQIDIFTATARAMAEALQDTGLALSAAQLEELFLAHEFYHWLEYSSGQLASEQCEPVEWPVLRLFRRRAWVRRVDEIAAFAFAKEVCGLPVHPKALDYLFLYRQQGRESGQIAPLLAALEEEYRRECL